MEAMRKSLNTSLSDSLSTARVFGIPLEEVQHSGQPGHEVPLLVRSIVEYIEEHGESEGKPGDSWYFLSSLYLFLTVIIDSSIIVTEMTPGIEMKTRKRPESANLSFESWFYEVSYPFRQMKMLRIHMHTYIKIYSRIY